MKRFYSRLLISTAVLVALACGAFAQELRIKSRRVIRPAGQGGRLAWSVPRNLIAYDKVGDDGFYDIFTMRPDGSEDACITCTATALPGLNIGSPRWHPSGNWMVFVAQREPIFINNNARPGVGVANDVWIADRTLTNFWKVADTSGNAANGGVLHPTFSHAGDKLFWAERISGNGWTLKIADFRDTNGTPVLSNVRELKPAGSRATLYESHDFTPDDSKVLFSGNLEGQPSPRGIDIYSLDITTLTWKNLTNTPTQWDEHSHVVPGLNKIIWMTSTQTYGDGGTPSSTLTEYWSMDLDGGNKHKMSWFNDRRSAAWNADGGGVVADFDFNADASQMMMYLISDGSGYGNTGMNMLLDLETGPASLSAASYLRPPVAPGSYLSTFGNNLATAQAASGGYPTSLAGTTAEVLDARGVTRAAQLVFVSSGQINFLLPDGTAPGPADLVIANSAGTISRETFTVENVAPSLFSANANGIGPAAGFWQQTGMAAAQLTFTAQGNTFVNVPIDLSKDTVLVLYGTGFRGGKNVTASIGGYYGAVQYAGPGGGYQGLDQVNVIIPSALAGLNREFPVYLTVDGVSANPVTVRVR